MQFQVNAAGKRIYPTEFKRKVLEELRGGAIRYGKEVSERYGGAAMEVGTDWSLQAGAEVIRQSDFGLRTSGTILALVPRRRVHKGIHFAFPILVRNLTAANDECWTADSYPMTALMLWF